MKRINSPTYVGLICNEVLEGNLKTDAEWKAERWREGGRERERKDTRWEEGIKHLG